MSDSEIIRWLRLILRRHYSSIQRQLLPKHDRRLLLSLRIARVNEFLSAAENDPYKNEIIRIYMECYEMDAPLDSALRRIEKTRQELYQQQWSGKQYNQPYTPVDDFVEEKDERKILKFIICWYASYHCRITYGQLYEAMKEEKGEKELENILKEARNFDQAGKDNKGKVRSIAFDWHYEEKKENHLKQLYNGLIKQRFIILGTDFETFYNIFSGGEIEKKIRWNDTLTHLIYLFEKLSKSHLKTTDTIDGFIESANMSRSESLQLSRWINSKIVSAFLDKDGKDITSKNLTDARNQLKNRSKNGRPAHASAIDAVIEALE